MVREVEPSIIEQDFFFNALKGGLRLDGRAMFDQRKLSLKVSEDKGSVDCSLGLTRVLARVSAQITKPRPDRPFEGLFQISSEINPLASFTYDAGRSSEDEVRLGRILEKCIARGGVVDREALCILAGHKVWSVRLDLHFLNAEGNLLDCASIAAMAALRNFRRLDVTLQGEEVTVHSITERDPVPLTIHHSPICVTFALFKLPKTCYILDPSLLEEQLSQGTVTLALNTQKQICMIQKSGGVPLEVVQTLKLVQIGLEKVGHIDQLVKNLLAQQSTGMDLAAIQAR